MKINSKGQFVKVPVEERFWDKVNKDGPIHPTQPSLGKCWLWTGATQQYGYGVIWTSDHKRRLRAHRVAWELINKKRIPKGKGLLHSCDNPPCINPSHTRPGTDADNRRDMVERGRALCGERNPQALLTEEQALDIRRTFPLRHKTGQRSAKDKTIIEAICRKHKISSNLAWRIASGERWKHLANRCVP